MGPIHFEMIEVLEEMDYCNHAVGDVRDEDDEVAAVLSRFRHVANGDDRDTEDEDRCQPDQPVGAELFRRPFEFLVGEVPLEVDEAPGDLADKAEEQETKKLVGLLRAPGNHQHRLIPGLSISACEAIAGNLGPMKALLALVLILLLVAIALPMGMGEMGDCPMCTSPKTIALGICAAVLSLFGLIILLGTSRIRPREESARRLLLTSSIYRPPRFA